MGLAKAGDGDNAKTYLATNLGASLDTLDTHDHSTNAKGLAVGRLHAAQSVGDLFYGGSPSALVRLPIGASGQVLQVASGVPAWGALATASASLGADVPLGSANTWYDGPSVSLAAGTWLLLAHITVHDTAAAARFTARLWDGSSVAASAEATTVGASLPGTLALAAVVTPGGTTTYTGTVANATDGSGVLLAACPDNGAGNTASSLCAVRLG
jgi:hypothetical protein